MNKEKAKIKFTEGRNIRILLFTLILISEIFSLVNSNFLSVYNLISIGQSAAPYAVLSLAAIFPIALGCTDLSCGAVCIAAATVAGKLYAMGMPLIAAIPVMLAFGALMGLLNGVLVSRLKLSPFIVTLGTMTFIRGISALFADQPNILFPTDSWYNRVFSTVGGIPIGFAWVALIGFLTGWFFRRTRYGRHILAVGGNEKAAVIAGLDTERLKVLAFTLSGLLSGAAAVLWSASFATIKVATGNGMELDAIAGAYIGGSAAAGGSVSALGAVIGAMLLVIIRNGLNFVLARLNVSLNSTYVTYAITGIIVVLAVFLDKSKEGRMRAKQDQQESKFQKYVLPAIAAFLALVMLTTNAVLFVKQEQKENRTLAVLMKAEDSAFWETVKLGAIDAAEENDYRLLVRGPETEDSSQLPAQRELMSVMLSENPAAMAVATIAEGFTDLLEEAYDRKVSVVQFDSGLYAGDAQTIGASDRNPLRGFVQGDSYKNASMVADAVYEALKNRIALSEEYIVGIIQHNNSVNAEARTNGFRDRLTELVEGDPQTAGKCTVYVEVKPSDANNAYKDGLEALYEKGASMIYMTAETVLNQVFDAVAASDGKYDGIFFASFDAGQKALQWLQSDGEAVFLGGVSQNPYYMGYLSVETLIRLVNGEDVGDLIVVPGVVYNKDNCQELIDKNILN